jgi:hypothetical protein
MRHPAFRRITWSDEKEQHWMPAATPLVVGAPTLCGKRVPPFAGATEGECEEWKTTPMCRRCDRAFWKIWRRAQRDFAADVTRDLEALTTVELPPD